MWPSFDFHVQPTPCWQFSKSICNGWCSMYSAPGARWKHFQFTIFSIFRRFDSINFACITKWFSFFAFKHALIVAVTMANAIHMHLNGWRLYWNTPFRSIILRMSKVADYFSIFKGYDNFKRCIVSKTHDLDLDKKMRMIQKKALHARLDSSSQYTRAKPTHFRRRYTKGGSFWREHICSTIRLCLSFIKTVQSR